MSKTRRALYLQTAAAIVLIGAVVFAARSNEASEMIARAQQFVLHLGRWSGVCYPLLFALCNILLLPGGVLCIGAGFFFGLWWGLALVFIGNAISTAISFAMIRWLGGRWLRPKLSRNRLAMALQPAVEREGWKIILLTQLHPLFPTSLLNYVYGLTSTRFRTYMLWASVGRIPGLFLYVYLGTLGQLGLNITRGKTHPRTMEYWTWGGAFVVTILIFLLLSRIAVEALRRANAVPVAAGGVLESLIAP